ncbi:MAG: hypothetical protein ACRDIU_05010, partial [Actinomycetota bacterium]
GDDPLDIAKQSLKEFEFVGTLERLRDLLAVLAFRMRWPPLEVQRINVTSRRPSPQELDDKSLEQLAKINELDLELYRFGCDLFELRWSAMLDEMLDESLRGRAKIRRVAMEALKTRLRGADRGPL